ncbi:hypothetical protein [Azohydromonas lata]|uniref:Lipoprotein n=1 Tax=Azohydromonas lata TaxID=45677 RepID=A0ABU5IRL7_9BURK|nr:hypothetical protein [Azohydromonas lata]MDZ5461529.1 hypothetical protein [Azohydromonas lata]
MPAVTKFALPAGIVAALLLSGCASMNPTPQTTAEDYATKQNADRVLIAEERRRKALHILMQDVRTAFWRTASAQKLRNEVHAPLADAATALEDARKAEAGRLQASLGMEPTPEGSAAVPLAQPTQSVAASLKQWDGAQVLAIAAPAAR